MLARARGPLGEHVGERRVAAAAPRARTGRNVVWSHGVRSCACTRSSLGTRSRDGVPGARRPRTAPGRRQSTGYVRATIPLGKDLRQPGVRDVTAVLDEGCSLRVEVTDAAGRVRDDAEVEVCLAMRGGAMSDSYGKAAARATGGGLVARGLRPARHRVEARAFGCAPRAVFVDVARCSRLRLDLGPDTRLEGVVRDAEGRPLPDKE